ncbi:phage major tail protein, phi13 family [Terribacillus aidingensis]|uniref:Phage major tail protein, phi13 family n=1 Tax=Terribacillus aidingensis TaxID=586416 RepID=A0A285NYJ8_9BACI|nr:major tail protein [Terribacillus aidingensis]SNZ14554.1 phage major tail protein, phi13 family [Terribacillus aidingensis]
MTEEKNYRASTGIDEFYYGVLDEVTNTTAAVERVKFLQTITVEMPQEPVRAYGDNITAELAVSSGNTSVTSGFHKVPEQDKKVLFGLEENEGLIAYGSEDTPPYVAVVFAKTYEDGSKEWVGLPKGMFMRSNITGQTKGDGVEFSSEEVTAEFMDRTVKGFENEKSAIFGRDAKGQTTNRDALFQAIFGQAHPSVVEGGTETTPEGV